MLAANLFLSLIFSIVRPVFSVNDFFQVQACCSFTGPHYNDTEYILIQRYNNFEMMEYNSTRGNWTGFTMFSIRSARYWNRDPYDALQRQIEITLLCKRNVQLIQSLGNLTASPTINLNSLKQSDGEHPAMLICSAYDFYPKQIRLTWLRNGQEVTKGVSYSDVMSDGDLYYQAHSYLEYFPTSGEKITCMVEHLSLSQPTLVDLDHSLPTEDKSFIVVGLCVLIVGLVVLSSGVVRYRRRLSHTALPPIEMVHGFEATPMKTVTDIFQSNYGTSV